MASAKLADSAAALAKQLPNAQAVCDCMAALLSGDLDGASLNTPDVVLLPFFAPGGSSRAEPTGVLRALCTASLARCPPVSPCNATAIP